jgi:hypothetical protein
MYLEGVNSEFRTDHGAKFAVDAGIFFAGDHFRVMITFGIDF